MPSAPFKSGAEYTLLSPEQGERVQQLNAIVGSVVEQLGLKLVAVRLFQQGKRHVLSITIHRKGSTIGLDDCEKVSRKVEAILDENVDEPIISGSYVLEVESPGIDRVLKSEAEFTVFEGETVQLTLNKPIDGLGSNFVGKLLGLFGSDVKIENPSPLKKPWRSQSAKAKTAEKTGVKEQIAVPLDSLASIKLHTYVSGGAERQRNG